MTFIEPEDYRYEKRQFFKFTTLNAGIIKPKPKPSNAFHQVSSTIKCILRASLSNIVICTEYLVNNNAMIVKDIADHHYVTFHIFLKPFFILS